MKFLARSAFTLLILTCQTLSFSFEKTYYVLRSHQPSQFSNMQHSLASIANHYHAIHILISQAYQVDKEGIVWGNIDSDVLQLSRQHGIKLMPLITNAKFDKKVAHEFLLNPDAQKRALEIILLACKQHHFYGVQFDFEMVALADKNALTQFYQMAADLLHKNGLIVSFAVAPTITDGPFASRFQEKIYENWEGAYDLKALGKSADFVTIMAYNQHAGSITTPGSTAGIRWVEATIKHALQTIPAHKISLGIPTYSAYWYTGPDETGRISALHAGIPFDSVTYLLKKFHAKLQWDNADQVNYTFYEHNWLNEYLFVEDAQSFKAKLALVNQYKLRGISVFYIGIEDPAIWQQL